jgi:O-antigen/teichoic acid export membrane protein
MLTLAISAVFSSMTKPLRNRTNMSDETNRSMKNAAFSLGEYAGMPLLYLAATPLLVKNLGLDLYGLWMLINSIVVMASTVNLGFGEATLRFVSVCHGRGETDRIVRGIRTVCSISLLIALISGSLIFLSAPLLVNFVLKIPSQFHAIAIQSLELGAALFAIHMIGSLFTATFCGYERYDLSAVYSLMTRGTILFFALVLTLHGRGLREILAASVFISLIGLVMQGRMVHRLIGASPWRLQLHRDAFKTIFGFGLYTCLQSTADIIFTQTDRFIIGVMLGTSALGVYSVCLQLAQCIHAVQSAGFCVLFPAVSRRTQATSRGDLPMEAKRLILLNAAISFALASPIILFGDAILAVWMGHDFVAQGSMVLRLLACAFFVMSLNVAVHYILLGTGDIKFVSFTNILAGAMSLLTTVTLIPIVGIHAGAMGRFMYGATVSLNFSRLPKALR